MEVSCPGSAEQRYALHRPLTLVRLLSGGQVGVGGAKGFFEQKAAAQNADAQMQEKDREYREQVKQQNEQKKASRAAFKEKASLFQ